MSWDFQNVAIVGCGAIGLYYGGRLAEAGNDVRFLARSGAAHLANHGLLAKSIHGDFHLNDIRVANNPARIGPVDLVIVAWKTTANHQLGEILSPLLHENTQVLTLQNGLGNCETIANLVGPHRVIGGLCFVGINRESPASIIHSAGGRLRIGEWKSGPPGRAETIAQRFRDARIHASPVPCLAQAQWEKLVWNIPFNGLSITEGGVTTDVLLSSPSIESEIRALMTEVIQAAHAQGIELSFELIESNLQRTHTMESYRTSSMIDFIEGREVEIDPIWRIPLARGKAAGAAMPALEALVARMELCLAARNPQ